MISGTPPGLDLNYDHREAEIKYRSLGVFGNISRYIQDYAKVIGKPSFKTSAKDAEEVEEKYILSRLNSTIKEVKELFADLQFNKVPTLIEELFLELSRFYIQSTREKLSAGTKQEKQAGLNTISEVYYKSLLMLAPVCPFITEEIYQLYYRKHEKSKSVHLAKWPDISMVDEHAEHIGDFVVKVVEFARKQKSEKQL